MASYSRQLNTFAANSVTRRILDKDITVFGKSEARHRDVIANRLGWVGVFERMVPNIGRIEAFSENVKNSGIRHLFVLGMGGSSLCPEVFARIFGHKGWLKTLTIVDTTAPRVFSEIVRDIDLSKSFFIVSSKSGTTLETNAQFRFFYRIIKDMRPLKAGNYFAAITDEGSELGRIARRNRFRELFFNPADIGGRYSALSFFGLVPGAFTNLDLKRLLGAAQKFRKCVRYGNGADDAGRLGALIGCGALNGFDKIGFFPSSKYRPFVPWIEQLLAESTGKEGRGIIPVDLGAMVPDRILPDWISVVYRSRGAKGPDTMTVDRHAPRIEIELSDAHQLGAEILKWELATALAAIILHVNPFDEPNVSESKKNAAAELKGRRGPRKKTKPKYIFHTEGIAITRAGGGFLNGHEKSAAEVIAAFIKNIENGDYLAILSYTEMDDKIENEITAVRKLIIDELGVTVLRGYGPRYLHSIGQLYKGGAAKGHFIFLEREFIVDHEVPTMNSTFGRIISAQARGDIKALDKRNRPLIAIDLLKDPVSALRSLKKIISSVQAPA